MGFFIVSHILMMLTILYINILLYYDILLGEEADDADLDAPKIYEPINTFEQLDTKLNQYMQQYNETVRGGAMDLVFFKVSVHFFIDSWKYPGTFPIKFGNWQLATQYSLVSPTMHCIITICNPLFA